ncbi:hypothetical protein RJT34_16328 [Clitoria ternatea]|uniref:Uncharacterized protein n=1 Tax=Clitoria ternatea TaxID=43366 RepID=A0AAN9PDK1_CLITE
MLALRRMWELVADERWVALVAVGSLIVAAGHSFLPLFSSLPINPIAANLPLLLFFDDHSQPPVALARTPWGQEGEEEEEYGEETNEEEEEKIYWIDMDRERDGVEEMEEFEDDNAF